AACYACHGEGAVIGQRIANRMSHGPLSNCLQCHAAPPPQPFAELETAEPVNTFVGLAAPVSAERAFEGAPPIIPHSTWMREQCLSCHGGLVGWPGLEVTHRWRTNCRQCHATSAVLEQAIAADASAPMRP
ncbi:MAG: nitrate reductase cytochrome c-type subunit, partial [Planctomycetes bacterium]|nr:nitrate reductase cytochrome c-type subunit [Planctomycetota bacterium]